jgi:hypothetical protein
MKLVDKQALEFLGAEGERLRRCSYDELRPGIGTVEEFAKLTGPDTLHGYQFTITRTNLNDGAVRVFLDGERLTFRGFGRTGCFDSFDKLPDNTVREIPKGDEDHCGKG